MTADGQSQDKCSDLAQSRDLGGTFCQERSLSLDGPDEAWD